MHGYKLIFTSEAREDVKAAEKYYNMQLLGLGKRFKNEVKTQLLLLKQNPLTRTVRYDNIRFALLDKFPYSIHYTIQNRDIIVYALISDYRNPKEYWIHGASGD